jgi:hypothetical protein
MRGRSRGGGLRALAAAAYRSRSRNHTRGRSRCCCGGCGDCGDCISSCALRGWCISLIDANQVANFDSVEPPTCASVVIRGNKYCVRLHRSILDGGVPLWESLKVLQFDGCIFAQTQLYSNLVRDIGHKNTLVMIRFSDAIRRTSH